MEENSETNCERNYDAVNDYGVQGANPETARAENPHEERDDFLPDCDETKKPYIGQRFDTIDDDVQFYKQYASLGGFDVRCSTIRHAFVVLKDEDVEMIPPKYIVPRWTKNARAHNTSSVGKDQNATCNKEADGAKLAAQLWKVFYNCMALSKGDMPEMKEMLNFMLEHKGKLLKSKGKTHDKSNNSQLLETFYGTPASTTITVKPPQISKNKGSGKRLKSACEKAIEKKKKDGRQCHYCDEQPARHDFCNCPLNPNKKKKQNKKLKA
nr:protein FAR1-RELATED SEQUENCE 5-like [Ipomoea trifida]